MVLCIVLLYAGFIVVTDNSVGIRSDYAAELRVL